MTGPEDLRRLDAESRVRLAAVADLRRQNALITQQSRRRLAAGRALLERCSAVERV